MIIGGSQAIPAPVCTPQVGQMCFLNDPRYDGNAIVGGKVVEVREGVADVHLYYGQLTTAWKPHTRYAAHLGRGKREARIETFRLESIYHHSFMLTEANKLSLADRAIAIEHRESINR